MCGAQIIIADPAGVPLGGVRIIGLTENNDSVACWATDSLGRWGGDVEGIGRILLEKPGFSPRLMETSAISNDTLRLAPATELSGFVVSQSQLMYRTYTIPRAQMADYVNFYSALNEIPNLTVLADGQLFLAGDTNVKLLLNGVETTANELKLRSKDDILQVKVCTNPPISDEVAGYQGIINVITKSELYGGNLGVEISQGFNPARGENTVGAFQNAGRSRFSIKFNNENQHFSQARYSQNLEYDFNGSNYTKTKTGLDSPHRRDDNNLELGYQNYHYRDYLYNISVGSSFYSESNLDRQSVLNSHPAVQTDATNTFKTRYFRPSIRNYFEKYINDGELRFIGNIRYQYQNSDYLSKYEETPSATDSDDSSLSVSDYELKSHAVFGEMQMEYYPRRWCFVWDVYGRHQWADYHDLKTVINERASFLGFTATAYRGVGNFSFSATIGALGRFVKSTAANSSTLWIPTPRASVSYSGIRSCYVSLDYAYTPAGPRISELSETPQWLDSKLVFHGNSSLRPYHQHRVSVRLSGSSKYFDYSLRSFLNVAPGMICNHYVMRPDYILETLVNLDSYTELSGQLDFTVKPLGSSKLEFYTRLIGAKLHGRGPSYRWNGYRFQWMSTLTYRLRHWTFNAYYQYPGRVAEGQLIMPRGQAWYVGFSYRPTEDLAVGLTAFRPFGDAFRDSERVVGSALVKNEYITEIGDWRNMLILTFSWNLSFGRNRDSRGPLMDNFIDDAGVLTK